jgi:60 kDa SS-A/Ro ribonucleoprotein
MVYSFHQKKSKETKQTAPIPGREQEMTQGKSGGYAFKADIWTLLRRCLLLGTAQNTFYSDRQKLSDDFVNVLKEAIAQDPSKVAQEILYASDGRSINNSAPIYALTILSASELPEAKKAFLEIFLDVVRTGTHLYEWLSYTKATRGFGKIIQQAGAAWFSKPSKELTYQLLKYQQRYDFSNRDALRLLHAKPITPEHDELFQWVTKGWTELPETIPSQGLEQIWWYEWLKRNPTETHKAITEGHLTHEMVAPVGQMDLKAWDLLFQEMPIGALLRNLASLTEIGVLRADSPQNLDRVESVLTNKGYLRKARIHPIDVLKALKTYASGGRLGKSKKTWTVIPRIVNILEKALELSFETVEPTGKVFLHAVDISSSMSYSTVSSIGLKCSEIAATMALVTAKAERNYVIRGFSTEFIDLDITSSDSFRTACQKTTARNFGGTDAAVAFNWAIENKFKADVICLWTDNESWAGSSHPSQALAKYRDKINPHVKVVYVSLEVNSLTQVDPNDKLGWDIAGFDPSTPKLIQTIATEKV